MNPLLAQFLIEAREQISGCTDGLLVLERDPDDGEALNNVFRVMHTLKGSSGLFDIPALTRVVHAAEDLLVAVREHRAAITPAFIDELLGVLDVVSGWLGVLEDTEALPDDAAAVATPLVNRLRASLQAPEKPLATLLVPAATSPRQAEPPGWVQTVPKDILEAAFARASTSGSPMLAISYAPERGCFFKGDDPLALMLQVPDRLFLAIEPPKTWPPLSEYDPFACLVGFRTLSGAPAKEVRYLLRYVAEQSEIVELDSRGLAALLGQPVAPGRRRSADEVSGGPAELALRLLSAQSALLRAPCSADQRDGRFASAGYVAGRALRHAGADGSLAALEAATAEARRTGDPSSLLARLDEAVEVLSRRTARAAPPPPVSPAPAGEPHERAATVLRVDQERIDHLMNLIGELVVAKNALPFLAHRAEAVHGSREMAREIKEQHAVVDRIALDLRDAIMRVRMLPVSMVFHRFPRLVRDLSRRLNKPVELEVEGEDTELDKTVIENLFDPLLHLVRNSLDHGIEADRAVTGKPEVARVTLAARQDNDQAIVSVIDDGAGIDLAVMRRKGIERGMLDADQAERMSDDEAMRLIFATGLSTASSVTDVSGRGVGMDVVRASVEKMGGRIELTSAAGQGTTVSLVLPLTMAVTRVMTVVVAGRRLGIPMEDINETVRVPQADIFDLKDRHAFLLRDRVVPLLTLAQLLSLPDAPATERVAVLVVRTSGQTVGLLIEEFGDVMELIVKPLEGALASLAWYRGSALLGDGKVLLVLNPRELLA